jgi:membrane-associated phospholipid phosphatase
VVRYVTISLTTLVLAALSIQFLDQSMTAFFMPDHLYRFRRIARHLTDLGEGQIWFGLALVTFLSAWLGSKNLFLKYAKDPLQALQTYARLRIFSLNLVTSLLLSGVILHILKWAIGRQRPHVTETFEPHMFYSFTTNSHFHSMPSGHSQVLLVAAVNLALAFPRYAVGIYVIAFNLAMTRVYTTQHFFSDVLVGCLTGYLGAHLALHLLEKRRQSLGKTHTSA